MKETNEINNNVTVSKTIRMPESLVKEIEETAKENNRNFSNQVIHILTKYLKIMKDN